MLLSALILILLSSFGLAWFYTMSVQPLRYLQKGNKRAYETCASYRSLSGVFELLILVGYALYFSADDPLINTIFTSLWPALVIGVILVIGGGIMMVLGMQSAGKETMTPNETTTMFGGIYKRVRHPQTTATMLMWIGFSIGFNRWALVIHAIVLSLVYIYATFKEEQDLIRKFGDDYALYKRKTNRFIPRIKHQYPMD